MYIIAGVTSAGKSTFASSLKGSELGLGGDTIVFAHQVINKRSLFSRRIGKIFHYNLMRPVQYSKIKDEKFYNFYADPAFSFIEKNASRLTAIIIVSSVITIKNRIAKRRKSELNDTFETYPNHYWLNMIENYDLKEIYERFSLEMERLGIPCRFYASVENSDEPFQEVHRYSIKDILTEGKINSLGSINPNLQQQFEYQKINLSHGISTNGKNRAASLLNALTVNLRNKSVLDVGTAIGSLAFSAEQMGARRVVGLEPKSNRLVAANEVKRVTNSGCEFYNATVSSFNFESNFDHVFLLNVVHHMPDFIHDLKILSEITNETLTIEFPGLNDPKYLSTYKGRKIKKYMSQPLIGVSLSSADQTFVFSPEALRRIMIDHRTAFKSYKVWFSPMRHRLFMRFFKDTKEESTQPIKNIIQGPYAYYPLSFYQRVKLRAIEIPLLRHYWVKLKRKK